MVSDIKLQISHAMRTVDPDKWTKKLKKANHYITTLPRGVPQASSFERRLRFSFVDALKEFLENCSVCGVRLVHKDDLEPNRYVTVVIFTCLVSWGIGLLTWGLVAYSTQPPLAVSLQAQQHRQTHVGFPGVAVCSHNLISRRALRSYAARLAALDNNSTFTVSEIERNLLAYGALVTSTAAPFDLRFIRFLATVDRETNVTNITLKLSPACEDLLVRCSWKAKITACGMLFATRLTPYGFCCVMNSRYSPEDVSRPPMHLNTVDHDKGLIVIMREDPADFAFLRRAGTDLEVIIFDGDQYPLKESTGVRSYPAPKNTSLFLKLNSWTQVPAPGLKYYSEQARGCRIPSKGSYESEAECLARCRQRAARVLCSCAPHWLEAGTALPPRGVRQTLPVHTVCTPVHLPCLIKHREMLTQYFPGKAVAGLEEESSDSVDCARCRPLCRRALHAAAVSCADYTRCPMRKQFVDKTGVDFTNTTVVRIFSTQDDDRLYVVESNLRWSQSTATVGSQWVLVCGVSCVSFLELVFFGTVRWYHHYRRRDVRRLKKKPSARNQSRF